MRKFKLSTQLIILFTSILLFSTGLFAILVVSRLKGIYVTETMDRLKSVVQISRENWNNNAAEDFSVESYEMEVAYIRYMRINNTNNDKFEMPQYNEVPEKSANIKNFIQSQSDFNFIMDKIIKDLGKPGGSKGEIHETFKASGEIFCVYEISEQGNIFILITNTSYANHIRTSVSFQVTFIFTIVLVFASFLIICWSKSFSTRIHRIKVHVRNLPNNNYEEEYCDDGNDEVSELSRSLEVMRIQLKNSEQDKREMLQNVSHDFKTPLSVIKSYAEAINDGMADEQTANIIISQAEILQAKVAKLLQYNRLEYLSKEEEFIDINMKEVIESVLNTYRFQTDVNLETELENVYYKGYMENYYTVLDNIIDNAKRYAKTVIKVTLNDDCLTIYNDGEHIDEKFINGLFKPYEKGSKGQFGLGMSIAKKTLDFFGYTLEVRNEEIGVTFIIKKKVIQIIHTI